MSTVTFMPADIRTPTLALTQGLNRVLEDGWTQGTYYDPHSGAFCSLGAMGGDSSAGIAHLAQAIRDSGWEPGLTPDDYPFSEWIPLTVIVNWNDAVGRTKAEVEAMFDAAIKLAKAA